jgi:hypothetical protein
MDQDTHKKEELLIATLYGMLSGQFKLVGIINHIHAQLANDIGLPEGQTGRMESALEDMNNSLVRLNELAQVAGMLAPSKDKPQ